MSLLYATAKSMATMKIRAAAIIQKLYFEGVSLIFCIVGGFVTVITGGFVGLVVGVGRVPPPVPGGVGVGVGGGA